METIIDSPLLVSGEIKVDMAAAVAIQVGKHADVIETTNTQ